MQAHIYIIYSESRDKYYVGCTENLSNRIEQHNAGRNKSTKSGVPWIVKYLTSCLLLLTYAIKVA